MFGHTPLHIILLFMLYAVGATVSAVACCYLLLRQGNAFAPNIKPPIRLRRWMAAFFASMTLSHVWYLPTLAFTTKEDIMQWMLLGGLLDCLTFIPLGIVVLLCMLQDRHRPLWPVWVAVTPLVVGMSLCLATNSMDYLPMTYAYFWLSTAGMVIYMVRAVRQYSRWLRDNYADLEGKEVGHSFVMLCVFLLTFGIYVGGSAWACHEYIVQICAIALTCYLLWRVETLSDLTIQPPLTLSAENELQANTEPPPAIITKPTEDDAASVPTTNEIGSLLQRYCVDTQLYLQHDLSLQQLAQAIGSNRTYLSRYFASLNTTYNAYINNLRIQHFINRYREAVAADPRNVCTQQLVSESGYRSYSTFSLAFKQRMGLSLSAWIRDSNEK